MLLNTLQGTGQVPTENYSPRKASASLHSQGRGRSSEKKLESPVSVRLLARALWLPVRLCGGLHRLWGGRAV